MGQNKNHHLSLEGVSFEPMTEDEADEIWELHSDLSTGDIYGIGPVTAAKIVKRYRTRERLSNLTAHELAAVEGVGRQTAERVVSDVRDAVSQ